MIYVSFCFHMYKLFCVISFVLFFVLQGQFAPRLGIAWRLFVLFSTVK